MKKAITITLLTMLVLISGCSSGESYVNPRVDFSNIDKVAVVDVIGNVGGEAARNQIADFFAMQLLKKGYSPIERAQVQTILDEQDFQASGLTPAEDAAKAGRIINVPTVIVINVPKFNEEMSITAKMLDVEDGSILWMGNGSGNTGKTLGTIVGATTGALIGATTTGKDDRVVGGVAGGVLGGVAGNVLAPEKAKMAQNIIEDITKTLPASIATAK